MDLKSLYVSEEEQDEKKEQRSKDWSDDLVKSRKLMLFGEVNDEIAQKLISQMLYLEAQDKDADITLLINSPGGSVTSGLAIYDVMNAVSCDVSTVCVGLAASMGAFLLTAGAKGKRYVAPNSEVMIHQVLWGGTSRGKVSDVEIRANQLMKTKERLNKLLAENSGHTLEEMEAATDKDNWLNANEAIAFGLADKLY